MCSSASVDPKNISKARVVLVTEHLLGTQWVKRAFAAAYNVPSCGRSSKLAIPTSDLVIVSRSNDRKGSTIFL